MPYHESNSIKSSTNIHSITGASTTSLTTMIIQLNCESAIVVVWAGRHAVLLLLSIWMMRMTILLYVDDDGNKVTPDRKKEESMAIKV